MQLLQLSFLTLLSFFLSLSLAAPLAIPAQTLSGIGHAQVFQRSSFLAGSLPSLVSLPLSLPQQTPPTKPAAHPPSAPSSLPPP